MTFGVHSVPAAPQPAPCVTWERPPAPALRGHLVGYSGFRSGTGARLTHRLMPLACTVLVVDPGAGVAVVTGPRAVATIETRAWGAGFTAGFTAAGASALLGLPMAELAGLTVPLADLLGPSFANRLAEAPSPFDLLDDFFTPRTYGRHPDPRIAAAWHRLHGSRRPVHALAVELGMGRRSFEERFRREIGLAPGAVARIARLQRAVVRLGEGEPAARAAAATGYADQPHLTHAMRTMTGLTPRELTTLAGRIGGR